ncbi:uncharacterized protein LOC141908640 isoform X2 [Tubulanus polymorphus]|uniref:uncharacterized protein LOC141908640 isoform X2 n=1 Tax=Tubulanus polymorphus TaxID=672921 RepID=UPI003DA3EE51
MSKTTVSQLYRQAESLKSKIADTSFGSNEAWTSRQSLQDIYQKLLVVDLEYALDKKVEQDLWNHVFKNQINAMQSQAKDRQNVKKSEIQASLNLFLETSSGFYVQLLEELCSAFKLDLPFRKQASFYGVLKESSTVKGIKMPKRVSAMYIVQYALVHLGDIARYRQQIDQAQTYYRHAASLVPSNGQPYNQLAILEAAKGNKLATVFYYIRSLAVKHPFPVAATNLEKFYTKASREPIGDAKGKLSMNSIVSYYLHFHALIHLCLDLDLAKKLSDRIINNLVVHINSASFNAYRLVQVVSINMYALHRLQKDKKDQLNAQQERCLELMLNFTVSLLDQFLCNIPKQEQKAKDYHTLPAIKLLLDWVKLNDQCLTKQTFKNSAIFFNLSRLLNNIQSPDAAKVDLETYTNWPLPEDLDTIGFKPLDEYQSALDFNKKLSDVVTVETENRLRCHRLLEHGKWISENFPSLNLLSVQALKSGKLQFRVPGAHVKLVTGSDSENEKTGADKKTSRQNVAIQAILQNSKTENRMEGNKILSERPKSGKKSNSGKSGQPVIGKVQILSPPHSKNQQQQGNPVISYSDGNRSRNNSASSQHSDMSSTSNQSIGNHTNTVRKNSNPSASNVRLINQPRHQTPHPQQSNIPLPEQNLASFPPLPTNSVNGIGQPRAGFYSGMAQTGVNRMPRPPANVDPDVPPPARMFPLFSARPENKYHPNHPPPPSAATSETRLNSQPDPNIFPNYPSPPSTTTNGPVMSTGGGYPFMFPPPPQIPQQPQQLMKPDSGNSGARIDLGNLFQEYQQQPPQQANWPIYRPNVPPPPFGIQNNRPMAPLPPHMDYDPLKSLFSQPPPGHPLFPGFSQQASKEESIDIWKPSTADLNLNIVQHTAPNRDSTFSAPSRQSYHLHETARNNLEPVEDNGNSSLFSSTDQTGVASYSLFSQSPWTMPPPRQKIENKGVGFDMVYNGECSSGQSQPVPQLIPAPPDHHSEQDQYAANNMQSLWSSGPSPLEKLLEQQKQQRQNDPH